MLKFGIISEVDAVKGLARVYFEEDEFVSGWLKMAVMRSSGDQVSFPFDINEHVYCLMDEGWEYGVVCGAVYDEKNLPSGSASGVVKIGFADGSTLMYNRNSHTLTLDIKGEININCDQANVHSDGEVNIEASQVNITATKTSIDGILEVSGAAVIQGIVSMGGMAPVSGSVISAGSGTEITVDKLTATDDILADGVSLKTHRHTSASAGNPTTGPIP